MNAARRLASLLVFSGSLVFGDGEVPERRRDQRQRIVAVLEVGEPVLPFHVRALTRSRS